jgi:hypothetical protein
MTKENKYNYNDWVNWGTNRDSLRTLTMQSHLLLTLLMMEMVCMFIYLTLTLPKKCKARKVTEIRGKTLDQCIFSSEEVTDWGHTGFWLWQAIFSPTTRHWRVRNLPLILVISITICHTILVGVYKMGRWDNCTLLKTTPPETEKPYRMEE